MAGPHLPLYPAIAAGATDDRIVRQYEAVIAAADAAKAVTWTLGGFAVDANRLPSGWGTLVTASALRANRDPVAAQLWLPKATGAEDVGKTIGDIISKMADAAPILEHVKRIGVGASAKAYWWGLEIRLTKDAAAALADLLGPDLRKFGVAVSPVLGAVGVSVPAVAAVGAIVTAVGSALSAWISAENKGDGGVVITLYFYIVPFVTPGDKQSTARTGEQPVVSEEDLRKIHSDP